MTLRRAAILLAPILIAPLALAACGPGENDPGPGGVTVEEARALDEAARMIDAQRLPPGALADPSATPARDPAPETPTPARTTPGVTAKKGA